MPVAVRDQEHLPPFRGTVSLALVAQTQLPLPPLLLLLLPLTWAALWLWCHPANVTLLLLLMQQPLTFTLASHGARLEFVLEFSYPDISWPRPPPKADGDGVESKIVSLGQLLSPILDSAELVYSITLLFHIHACAPTGVLPRTSTAWC